MADCRKDSVCAGLEDAWCYSAGFYTDGCIAWRAGLDNPPMPIAPVVPMIDTSGGSSAANPNYGKTDATVQDIIDASAAADRQQLSDWFSQTADTTAAIAGDGSLSTLSMIAIGVVGLFAAHYIFGSER